MRPQRVSRGFPTGDTNPSPGGVRANHAVATDSPTGPVTVLDDSGTTKFAADVAGRNFPDRWHHSDATRLLRHGKDILWPDAHSGTPTSQPPSGTCTRPTPTWPT